MTTMSDLMAQASSTNDIEALKRLPIAYVLEQAGHLLELKGDGYACICPFHADSDPSLELYGERLEKFKCYPCGAGGDVLDMIGRLHGLATFGEQAAKARELLADMGQEQWTGPTVGVKRVIDMDAIRRRLLNATNDNERTGAVYEFLQVKAPASPGLAFDDEWLMATFGIGEEQDRRIVIPYWNRSRDLVTLKHRTPSTKAISAAGSDFSDVLYGEWRDNDPARTVVLCEGESDVWAATFALTNFPAYTVLGLPTGAGAHPKQATRLHSRNVVLAFDGDEAGRKGVKRWHAELLRENCTVSVVPMPDGYDIAKLTPQQIVDVVQRARPVPVAVRGLSTSAAGYYRPGKEEEANTPVGTFVFQPERELRKADSEVPDAYEGTIVPHNRRVILPTQALLSKVRLGDWANSHGATWLGSDRDAAVLLSMLQAEGPFLAHGRMSHVAGLHAGHFIWPGGRIGPEYWVYVPESDTQLASKVEGLVPGPWDVRQVPWLRALHHADVMDPILAWLAIAPLRSLLQEFPVLAVMGSSGSGKTTLVRECVRAFSGAYIDSNLKGTTEFAIEALMSSTNAFPVHFDEFRAGAREQALNAVRSSIRDAYTMQGSTRGGRKGGHWSDTRTDYITAPIVITGEDAFSETSHNERMVIVALPNAGKRPENAGAAMLEVKSWGNSGLAHAYLTYLHERMQLEDEHALPALVPVPAGPASLPERNRINLGVLNLGWTLLGEFVRDHGGDDIGAPNWSRITERAAESSLSNPIRDAIQWGLEHKDSEQMVVRTGDMIHVRLLNFVRYADRECPVQLPGGAEAVRDFIVDQYGAKPSKPIVFGKQVRAFGFPAEALDA